MIDGRRRLLAMAAIAVFLAGCGRQVAVEPPPSGEASGDGGGIPAACRKVGAALPDAVDGAGRRPTTPSSEATAAWGDPAIVWRCGVGRPSALAATSVVLEVGGITWFPEDLTSGTLFTTVDWPTPSGPVYAEVAIPARYAAPAAILADLGPALLAISNDDTT